MAQNVTMYGRLDVGLNNSKTTVGIGAAQLVVKGNNVVNEDGLSTGLWGIMGSEDLGGGMKANFKHEMDLDMDAGALNVAAGRNSTLGLSGGFGEVRLGRSYTPAFGVIGMSDVFGTTGASTVNLVGGVNTGVRASNAIFYTSPSMGGFVANVMVQKNDASTTLAGVETRAKTSANGFSLTYASGPLAVAYGYNKEKGSAFTNAIDAVFSTVAADRTAGAAVASAQDGYAKTSALSATYDMGAAKFYAGYTVAKSRSDTTDAASAEGKSSETNLGVAVPMGAITLMAGAGRNKLTTNLTTGELTGTDVVLGATYALSKRTTTYIKTGTSNKMSGDLNGVALSNKTTRTSIGLRHTF